MDPATGLDPMPTPNELYDEAVDLRDKGDCAGAISKLEEAVAADPAFAIGHGMLAKLYVDFAEVDKAIYHAKKVIEIEPDDTFSYTAFRSSTSAAARFPRPSTPRRSLTISRWGLIDYRMWIRNSLLISNLKS